MSENVPEDTIPLLGIIPPPTEPGFYHYDGGAQRMVFLLTSPGNGSQWYAIFDNGVTNVCDWEFIEQALSVWNLVKLSSEEKQV